MTSHIRHPRQPGLWRMFILLISWAASGGAQAVQAQGLPAQTISGGLASTIDGGTVFHGFFVEGARKLNRRIGLVGEVQRSTGSSWQEVDFWNDSESFNEWTDVVASGGVRFSWPQPLHELFVQALAGVHWQTWNKTETIPSAVFTFGAGVNAFPTKSVGFRVGGDVQAIRNFFPMLRLTAGLVVSLDRR